MGRDRRTLHVSKTTRKWDRNNEIIILVVIDNSSNENFFCRSSLLFVDVYVSFHFRIFPSYFWICRSMEVKRTEAGGANVNRSSVLPMYIHIQVYKYIYL